MAVTLPTDSNGWSIIPAAPDREVYVDNGGDDVTGDGSVGSPYETIGKAYSDVLTGESAHVILTAGQTFTGNCSNLYGKDGKSSTEPIITYTKGWDVDGAASGGRAIISEDAVFYTNTNAINHHQHIAFIGLEFTQPNYDGENSNGTFVFYELEQALWEDCYWHDHGSALNLGKTTESSILTLDLLFRRCVFNQLYAAGSSNRSSTTFIAHADLITFYQCTFMRGGWHPIYKPRDTFVRDIYATNSTKRITLNECILIDGASANQLRAGGTFTRNYCSYTPNFLNNGFESDAQNKIDHAVREDGFMTATNENVFQEMPTGNLGGVATFHSGFDITKSNEIKNNIMTDDTNAIANYRGFRMLALDDEDTTNPNTRDNGFHGLQFTDNIIYKVARNLIQIDFENGDGTVSGNVISGNTFVGYEPASESDVELVSVDTNPTSGVTWSGNKYWHMTVPGGIEDYPQTDTRLFKIGDAADMDFDDWTNATTGIDKTGTWGDPGFSEPTRNMMSYYTDAAPTGLGQTTTGTDNGVEATGTITCASVGVGDTAVVLGKTYTAIGTSKVYTIDEASSTWSGDVVTIELDIAHGLTDGQIVTVAGLDESGQNGQQIVVSTPTSTSFTYAEPGSGTVTSTSPEPDSGTVTDFTKFDQSGTNDQTASDLADSMDNDSRQGMTIEVATNEVTITAPLNSGVDGNNVDISGTGGVSASGANLTGGADGDRIELQKLILANRKGDWDTQLMALDLVNYVRAGFDEPALGSTVRYRARTV